MHFSQLIFDLDSIATYWGLCSSPEKASNLFIYGQVGCGVSNLGYQCDNIPTGISKLAWSCLSILKEIIKYNFLSNKYDIWHIKWTLKTQISRN